MQCSAKSGLYAVLLVVVAGLSACSAVSAVAEKPGTVLSRLNPFSSAGEEAKPAAPEPAQVTVPATPDDAESIRVEATPPTNANKMLAVAVAEPVRSGGEDVTTVLADNKVCTTFCALPRKPR